VTYSRLVALLGFAARATIAQSPALVVRDYGPGPTGRYLAATLAKPDTRVLMADSIRLTPDSIFPGSIVVIGRRVIASSDVKGDIIVVGGDLFIHAGATIAGQAIAIGGGVYRSLLGQALGGQSSYRDFTFDTVRVNGALELTYRELNAPAPGPPLRLPFSLGGNLPTYDRSNGTSLSIGPSRSFADGAASLTALATYRSQIGRIDPSLEGDWQATRRMRLTAFAGRASRTNDDWITSDLSNSLNALFIGRDTRNWYRADVAALTASRSFERPSLVATYRLGGQVERASAVRPVGVATSHPWSFSGGKSEEGMRRPNPQVPTSRMSSIVAGGNFLWNASDVKAVLDIAAETPVAVDNAAHFVQTTIDGQVSFPTFGTQSYRFDAHAVVTAGDTAPMQRWAYVGGSGTLGTVEPLLILGGDQLLFLENRYIVPVPAVKLPFVGSPTVTFRHILGTAGVKHLPSLTQILGVRLSVMLLRTEFSFDTGTRKTEFNAGLSLVR
jgi:hypothetical protein